MKKAIFFAIMAVAFIAQAYASWDGHNTEKKQSGDAYTDDKNKGSGLYNGVSEPPHDIKSYLDNKNKNGSDTTRADRKKLHKYYKEWEKLTPGMKKSITKNYRKWLELSPEQRKKIEGAYIKYRSATAEEKEKIRKEARKKRLNR
jgi:hypothetical protein